MLQWEVATGAVPGAPQPATPTSNNYTQLLQYLVVLQRTQWSTRPPGLLHLEDKNTPNKSGIVMSQST